MAHSRSIAEQIERQARRWRLMQRVLAPSPRPLCVALSRLPGSGAAELGRRVAEKLDYGFFGIELLDQIARERGVERHLLQGLDEHLRSAIERYVGDAFRRGAVTESDYLRHVVHAITALGERGGAVVLGRGAPFILPPERALRVLVIASREDRVARIAAERRLRGSEADRVLRELDAERRGFLRHHFKLDPDEAERYDLVVNTTSLGLDGAVELVLGALRCKPATG